MPRLIWCLLFCSVLAISEAGFCTKAYSCGSKCSGWWFWRRCPTTYCAKQVCCPGWTGENCDVDIDECEGNHGCEHNCTNTDGSFHCSCPSGYRLTPNGKGCEGHCCTENYKCSKQCSSTSCSGGWWGGQRCSTRTYVCYNTCRRQVCCEGYTGPDCTVPADQVILPPP